MKTHMDAISNLGKIILVFVVILCLTAVASARVTIFEEDFESPSPEWTFVNNGSGTVWAIDGDKNHTLDVGASQSANCADNGTYAANTDASIKINIDMDNYVNTRLSFWVFYDGELSFDYGQVKINGDVVAPTMDEEGFTGYACRDNCPPDWIKRDVDLRQYDQQEITLEFYYHSDDEIQGDGDGPWDGFYVDDIEITGEYTESAPDAPVIDTLTDPNDGPRDGARDVPLTTELNWTNPGAGSNTHDVEVLMNVNLNPPTTVVRSFSGYVVDSLSNAAIGGPLSGSSTYYWKVTTKNTTTNETASRIWSFKTQCAVVDRFPYIEGFEGDPENDNKWEGLPPQPTYPNCWTVIPDPDADPRPTNYWEQSASTSNSGSYSARGPWASEGGVQWMLTPELDMSEGECNLKFALKGSTIAGTNLQVYIGKTNSDKDLPETGNNDQFTLLKSYFAGINMPSTWEDQIIDIAHYSGKQPTYSGYKYIAFKLVDDNGWSVYLDDVQVYEFNDRTSTITDDVGVTPGTDPFILSTADTESEAVYVFDVSFNDGALGAADGYPTIIDQIKIIKDPDSNQVADWTKVIAGAKLFGPDLGAGAELIGEVSSDSILFKGDKIISVAHAASETYQLKIWLKKNLSVVQDHDRLGFKLRHADIITNVHGSSIFNIPDPEEPVVSPVGIEIEVTASKLAFTTQPHNRAVVNRIVPIIPVVSALDENGNLDLDWEGTVTLSNTNGLQMGGVEAIAENGVVTFDALMFTEIGGTTYLETQNNGGLVNCEYDDGTASTGVFITGPPVGIWKDSFEDSEADWELSGEFEINAPNKLGGSTGYPDPENAYEGIKVLGTDLTGLYSYPGDCEPDIPDDPASHYTATSPIIDCTGKERVALKFYRWLNTQNVDTAYIDVFDGVNWQKVWQSDDIITENAWSFHEIDISAHANDNPDLRIRFGYGPSDGNFFYSGWNIDSVEVVEQPEWTSMNYSESQSGAFQEITNYVMQGAVDQEIIGVKIVTNNPAEPILNLTGLQFSTQGGTQNSDIAKAKVYYTEDSPDFAPINQFGTDKTTITDTFSITGSQALLAGVNYFWLVYDIASDAEVNHFVDAELVQITIDTTNYAPQAIEPHLDDPPGDPDGNRKIIRPPELEDVVYILQVLTGYTVSHPYLMTLDYNANGKIDMGDALFVLEYLAGLRST